MAALISARSRGSVSAAAGSSFAAVLITCDQENCSALSDSSDTVWITASRTSA